jgi:uncharacterized protein (TIGR04551 family)
MLHRFAAIAAAATVLAGATAMAQAPTPVPSSPRISEEEKERLRREIRAELEREMDERLEAAREEMRDEIRAALVTQGANQAWEDGWDDEWEEVTPRLDLFEVDGYFRTRMDLFHQFDLRLGNDPSGNPLFPIDPQDPDRTTVAGANMRLRIDPTLNVSEEVRIRAQIDVFDNLVFGATPRGGFALGQGNLRYPWVALSPKQEPPRFNWNDARDSIVVKRAWAEVRTPIGELRFGRMADNFGLGMNVNDGNCLDCDHGDTVDRFMFAMKIADHIVAPALDFVSEGPTSANLFTDIPTAQPFDRTQSDDARAWVLTVLRRDTEEEIRRMRVAGKETFINYGLHFSYRTQSWDAQTLHVPNIDTEGSDAPLFVPRDAWAVIPDVWFRFQHKKYRLEFEFVTVQGALRNRPSLWDPNLVPEQNHRLRLNQFGAVLQNEILLADDRLSLGLEVGFASGDRAPGFGNFPGRADPNSDEAPFPQRGVWEGAQFNCFRAECSDNSIDNFSFNRDYRIDLILFREILGAVTDVTYVRPSLRYDILDGLDANLAIIYSQVNARETTPTGKRPLGIEVDAIINYVSSDGFIASIGYGVLFPLSGLNGLRVDGSEVDARTAQAVRGYFGIVY